MIFRSTMFWSILIAGSAMAEPPATAKVIIEKAIAARGGKDNICRREMSYVLSEGVQLDGEVSLPVEIERWDFGGLRQRSVFTMGESGKTSTVVVVLNGDSAWIRHDGSPANNLVGRNLEDLKAQVASREMQALYPLIENDQFKLTLLDDKIKNGELCWCIQISRKGSRDAIFAFSKKNYHLISITDFSKDDDTVEIAEIICKDYRKVNDYLVPHKLELYINSRLHVKYEVKKLIWLEEIDKSLLAKPEE